MSMDIASPATAAQIGGPVKAPTATKDVARAEKAAQDFEGVFLTQMLGQMFSGLSTDGPFGGGQGEQMFRSLMMDEYGKQLSKQGGIGLAPHITAELLKHQEQAQAAAGQAAAAQTAASNAAPAQGATP